MKSLNIHAMLLLAFVFLFNLNLVSANSIQKVDVLAQQTAYPFSTDTSRFTHWNGFRYVPITIKGMNLGVSVPGTYPGELAASKEYYWKWFQEIKDAGYNMIRVYTLHYPRFYEVLDSFNIQHPNNPIYFMQGVWLEEELPGYNHDLFFNSASFLNEIKEDVDCVHGNRVIASRLGKAYGTYTVDVSKWLMGYLIGREVSDWEVNTTNTNNPTKTSYAGTYLSISNVHAAEVFATQHLDSLLVYEQTKYNTQRPVAFSSWPTLDPLTHPSETHTTEDDEMLELGGMDYSKAKAGFFVSYHAYPYYPDFISRDSAYQSYTDSYGTNKYLGYLTALKKHYQGIPLLIAEFGLPSSWGVAHYSRSDLNHGGYSELEQGIKNYRMFKNFEQANCAGGIQFAWIDEWFKRTWITDPFDFNIDDRVMWHNVTAAEQNFGLLGYRKKTTDWQTLATYTGAEPLDSIQTAIDHTYFQVKMHTKQEFATLDTLWVAFDTYNAALGEKKLITGETLNNGAEFLLRITNDQADLFVTEAYDLYGIWHGISPAEQKFQSIATTGAPWKLVRWKNNSGDLEMQYIGHLKVNRLNMAPTSMDAITMAGDSVLIRIPWSLLQFVNPAYRTVIHDDRATASVRETQVSDGVALAVRYKNTLMQPATRFTWTAWNHFNDVEEYKKDSYYYLQDNIKYLPGAYVAVADNYRLPNNENSIISDVFKGLLVNDVLLENGSNETVLIDPPTNGFIHLQENGTFTYFPDQNFIGKDKFTYKVLGEELYSDTATVSLDIYDATAPVNDTDSYKLKLYPNPVHSVLHIQAQKQILSVMLITVNGELVLSKALNAKELQLNVSSLSAGVYVVYIDLEGELLARKIIIE